MRFLTAFAFLILTTITIQAQVSAHYINIGQGDSILIELKTAAILIDAGRRGNRRYQRPGSFDQLSEYIL